MVLVKKLAVLVMALLSLTGCNEPDPGPAATSASVSLSLIDEEIGPLYTSGEPIGLTVHFAEADRKLHGLPDSAPFIASNGYGARAFLEMAAWVDRGVEEQVFECFGPIEIRDEQAKSLFTIEGHCPVGHSMSFSVFGDPRYETSTYWEP